MIKKRASIFLMFGCEVNIVAAQADTVSISIEAKKNIGSFIPLWNFFGYDEANYTTMKDGKAFFPH